MRREIDSVLRLKFNFYFLLSVESFIFKILKTRFLHKKSRELADKKTTHTDMKKTVVLGATPDPSRFAYKAAKMLLEYGHEIVPVGIKKGELFGHTIINDHSPIEDVDTITLYVGPKNQETLLDYIIDLKPKRIIFNPGTENDELIRIAKSRNIEPVIGCTLVMLSVGTY